MPATPAAASTASEGATSFDETALAAPPPRAQHAGQTGAPLHPPVESLSSYDARTRTILHVLTQLLLEKGVVSREELHARVAAFAAHDDAQRDDAPSDRD